MQDRLVQAIIIGIISGLTVVIVNHLNLGNIISAIIVFLIVFLAGMIIIRFGNKNKDN